MSVERLSIDTNNRNVDGAVTNDANLEIRQLRVDPSTNRLLVDAAIDAGDIEIGAVEIKDGTTDTRAEIDAASTARTAATNTLVVQPIDASGNVLGRTAANTARTTATLVDPVQIVDAAGKVGFNPLVWGEIYSSPSDFQATYTSSTTITITGAPFTVDDSTCYVIKLDYKPTGGAWVSLINTVNGVSMVASSGVITVSGAGTPFASGDTYRVMIATQKKSYDSTTDTDKVINQSPDRASYVQDSLLDTTNVTAATNYYPSATGMSMDGFKDMSLSGKIIEGDAVLDTIQVQATNDEDTTNADWVTVYGYRTDLNAISNIITTASVAGTYTFAWDFDNFNYSYFRVVLVTADNTNTVIIKLRRKSL